MYTRVIVVKLTKRNNSLNKSNFIFPPLSVPCLRAWLFRNGPAGHNGVSAYIRRTIADMNAGTFRDFNWTPPGIWFIVVFPLSPWRPCSVGSRDHIKTRGANHSPVWRSRKRSSGTVRQWPESRVDGPARRLRGCRRRRHRRIDAGRCPWCRVPTAAGPLRPADDGALCGGKDGDVVPGGQREDRPSADTVADGNRRGGRP